MSDYEHEEWRDVVGYEGRYQVSNMGRVWSARSMRPLTSTKGAHGYLQVGLCNEDGKSKTYGIHRLVAMAFIGELPDGCEVNHRDGCKTNNVASNLEYVTHSQNIRHAIDVLGRELGPRKLTNSDVLAIIELLNSAQKPIEEIALQFNISQSTISLILHGRIWKQFSHLIFNSPDSRFSVEKPAPTPISKKLRRSIEPKSIRVRRQQRNLEILQLHTNGLTREQIAAALGVDLDRVAMAFHSDGDQS